MFILNEEKLALRDVFKKASYYFGAFLLLFWSYQHYQGSIIFWLTLSFILPLWASFLIDLKRMILPDSLTLISLLGGITYTIITQGYTNNFLGASFGYILFLGLSYGFYKATGKEGLGFGDVKLIAALGLWVGLSGLPLTLLIAAFSAMPVFLIARLIKGESVPLPFGPFLIAGAWLVHLYQLKLWDYIITLRTFILS